MCWVRLQIRFTKRPVEHLTSEWLILNGLSNSRRHNSGKSLICVFCLCCKLWSSYKTLLMSLTKKWLFISLWGCDSRSLWRINQSLVKVMKLKHKYRPVLRKTLRKRRLPPAQREFLAKQLIPRAPIRQFLCNLN